MESAAKILVVAFRAQAKSLCLLIAQFIGKHIRAVRETQGWLDLSTSQELKDYVLDHM